MNEKFIGGQLIVLAEEKFESVWVFFSLSALSVPTTVGGRQGQERNRPVKCVQSGAEERAISQEDVVIRETLQDVIEWPVEFKRLAFSKGMAKKCNYFTRFGFLG